ncbi:hypothetical protein ACQHIV_03155 [Kribbella sp. GL6]|uniref:hypothetical protein n=1 Tax=Kribbella sp. GL6 TaxID=3419765 RepID=UPI003D08E638
MTSPSGPVLPGRVVPAAARVVDDFHRTGSVELKTSLKSIAGIVAVSAPVVAVSVYGIVVGGAAAAKAVLPVMGLPILGVVAWILWLLVPRVRVVIDRTGVRIRGDQVEWSEVTGIRVEASRSRGTYYYVVLDRAGARPVSLPLLLSTQAKALRDALEIVRAEQPLPPAGPR